MMVFCQSSNEMFQMGQVAKELYTENTTMVAVSFKPSQVRPNFIGSSFQKGEKEAVAAQIVTFLTKNGDAWDISVGANALLAHSRQQQEGIPDLFQHPFNNRFFAAGSVQALHDFADEGYTEWNWDRNAFKVTQKFIDFFATYAAK